MNDFVKAARTAGYVAGLNRNLGALTISKSVNDSRVVVHGKHGIAICHASDTPRIFELRCDYLQSQIDEQEDD